MTRRIMLGVFGWTCAYSILATIAAGQATHTLKPTPKTVAWGYYDAKAAPVLHVKSGDTVEIQTPVAAVAAQDGRQPIIYVKHLEPPLHYPGLARQVGLQGIVVVKVAIGADGRVVAAKALTPEEDPQAHAHPLLVEETEKLLKKWTFGCANCPADSQYEKIIRFTYRLEGEGILYDDTRVLMDFPDEIILTASPVQCDHCPRQKKGKK